MAGEKKVVAISAEGTHRDSFRKAFMADGYSISFISSIMNVTDFLHQVQPDILLHDWNAVDPSQSRQFQMKLGKLEAYKDLFRVILVNDFSKEMLALAHDAGIHKVLSARTLPAAIVNQITMTLSAQGAISPLQKMIRDLRFNPENYSQEDVDQNVEECYEKFPQDDQVRLEYGNLCLRNSELDVARELAEGLVREDKTNVRAMNLLSRALMKSGDFESATKLLEQANGLSPSNPERLTMLGDAFFGKGDLQKAKSYYQSASSIDPANKGARAGLGNVSLSEGDMGAALDLMKNSASEEEAASFFNNAAVAAVKSEKFDQALGLYDAALNSLKTNKLKPQIMFNMALAMKRQGDFDQAMKTLKRVVKMDPDFEKAKRQLDVVIALRDQAAMGNVNKVS